MAPSSQSATIFRRLQNILESQVTWSELSLDQQDLFDNLNFNLTLNTDSPQQTYQLLQTSPDLLSLLQDIISSPLPSTPPTATVPEAIITANLLEESQSTIPSSTQIKYQSPQTTVDWVNLAIKNHLRNQQISSRLQSQPKQQLQQIITRATPKQNQPLSQTQETLKNLVSTIDNSLDTSLTPLQKTQVLHLAETIIVSSSLQTTTPSHLIATTTAINLIKKPQKTDPIKIARQIDRLSKSLQQSPSLLDQITTSQQEVSRFVHTVSTQPQTIKIINQLHTQITPKDIDHVTKLYQKTIPSQKQKIFSPFTSQKAEEIASAIEVLDPTTATTIRTYNQGLTSQDIDLIIEQPTARLTPSQHQQLLLVKSQLVHLEQSSPSSDIRPTPLPKITQFFHRSPLGKVLNYLPSNRFTKTLKVILHPRSAIKSYIGHRVGKHLVVSFYKKFATHITNKSARFVVKSVLRQGVSAGLKTSAKLLTKKAATWLASKGITLAAEGIIGGLTGGLGTIIIEAAKIVIKIVTKVAKKIYNNLQSAAVSIWGEKIKARDIIAAPAVFFATIAAGFTTAISVTASAMAAAATSAGLTIGISAAIAGLLYLTAFTAAPLISTIAQLESTPGANFGISNTCAETENIFIYQGNPAWSNTFCKQCSPSGNCNIGGSGCGSASMTMILKSFGANVDVKQVWHLQHSLKGYVYTTISKPYIGCGTDNNNSLKVLNQSKLSVSNISINEIDNVLSNCGLVLVTGQVKHNGEYYGHLIVIIGHNGNQITTLDPGRSDGDHFVHTVGNSYKIVRAWGVVP